MPSRQLLLATSVAVLAALPLQVAGAQRRFFDDDVDGAETCRDIWREYGRFMSGDARAVFCEIREIGQLPRRERITVDGGESNGIHVRGDRRRGETLVRLIVQAQGRTVDEARELAKLVTLDLRESMLRAEGTGRNGRRSARAVIAMETPERANLSLEVENGPIDVADVHGEMDIRAQNGPIGLSDIGGDVRARSQNGPISVALDGPRWDGRGLDAEAQNGPVELKLPRAFAAALEVGTQNGPMDVNYPLTLNRLSGRRIEATIGGGGPPVRVVTRNGPMSLRQSR